MHLTSKSSRVRDPEKFPTLQLFLLAIVRLAEPIALTSIFPYTWVLVKRFQVGDDQDASFYAGLLISAFSLAEALTSMYWGGLSDRIGRKPILLIGCAGTIISMLLVGFATTFWIALFGRALGGALNGNIGVIQTMVSEMVTNPKHEPRAYSVMPFVWSIGTIIGPCLGGLLADPVDSFPGTFPKDGLFGRFPYLLPNLICAGILAVSMLAGFWLLEETHPEMQPRISMPENTYISDETPLMATADAIKTPAVDLRAETYGTFPGAEGHSTAWRDEKADCKPSIFTNRIIGLILALGIFSYHSMTFDHLIPIFLEDEQSNNESVLLAALLPTSSAGGLGLSLRTVGNIMAVNGAIALVVQAVIFPLAAEIFGVYRLFLGISVLQPLTYILMTYLPSLPESFLFVGIYGCLIIRNILQIIAYPLLLILIKDAAPTKCVLGKVNGFAASAGAACRTLAPPISGYLYSIGSRNNFTALAWYGSALVAVIGSFQVFAVKRAGNCSDQEAQLKPSATRVADVDVDLVKQMMVQCTEVDA